MIQVALVDDQPVVRSGLRMMLDVIDDITVVGEADNGTQALQLVRTHPVDVVVMDLRMPGMDGTAATTRLAREHPRARVLVLTTFDDDEHLYHALTAGARGFLAKHASAAQIVQAIRSVARDEPAFSPDVLSRIVAKATYQPAPSDPATHCGSGAPINLTAREREVLLLLPSGASNHDIADRLHVGVTTVKTHIASLINKTGRTNRVQLAVLAIQVESSALLS